MASKGEETALGTARGRFIESLPRKAIELRGAIALLTATPAAEGPREDMRRRLHTLYASSLVFRNDALAAAVKEGIDRLDGAREASRALTDDDLELLTRLVKRIPELRGEEPGPQPQPSMPPIMQTMTGRPAPVVGGVPVSAAPAQPERESGSQVGPLPQAASTRAARTLTGLAPVFPGVQRDSLAPKFSSPDTRNMGLPRAPEATRLPVLSRVLQVLVLAPPPMDTDSSAALATSSLNVSVVHTVRAALEAAKSHAPDVIAADAGLAQAGVLIGGLRGDPLTDFIPVVLLESTQQRLNVEEGRELGADDVLTRPFSAARLVRALGRVTGTLIESSAQLVMPAEASLDELAGHVAEEIRRGIVDAAETGRDLRVPLGEGAEVLAAAWAAVARVRAFVSQQTAGKVRFSDRALRSGASLLVLGKGGEPQVESNGDKPLLGRRVLVVDDDTAVVWFFASVLREEGATVLEATDGRDALYKARAERPDVVISDVLMPQLDGFALCRELKRDPALSDVPVILISWKEDLLVRMRELSAGASGYLRKEAGATQIVSSVRDVLKARMELEAQLRGSGEVRGNLEGTGVVPLLRSVRRARPDARITLRDAYNHFECDLRDGRMAQLTRTASDGTFSRGERALPQLLGVNAGRFAVADLPSSEGPPPKQVFEGTLDEVLTRGARELGALLDAVSLHRGPRVARIVLDEDAYAATFKQATEGVRKIVERLHAGEAPAALLHKDPVPAALLESLLMELARRGAVRGVVGAGGEDLVAEARERRANDAPTELGSPQSLIPQVPNPVISVLRPPTSADDETAELPSVLDPAAAVEKAKPAVEKAKPAAEASDPGSSADISFSRAESTPFPPRPELQSGVPDRFRGHPSPDGDVAEARRKSEPPAPSEPTRTKRSTPPPPAPVDGTETVRPTGEDEQPTDQFNPLNRAQAEALITGGLATARDEAETDERELPAREEPEPREATSSAQERELRDSVSAEPDLLESEERRSKSTLVGWGLALLVLGAIGFFLGRREPASTGGTDVEALGKQPEASAIVEKAPEPNPPVAEPAQPVAPAQSPLAQGAAPVLPRDSGFEIYDGIVDKSLSVPPDHALLMVEAPAGLAGAELSVDGAKVGALPAHVAVSEGIHELAITHGDAVTYRFASVHRGKTWMLKEPL